MTGRALNHRIIPAVILGMGRWTRLVAVQNALLVSGAVRIVNVMVPPEAKVLCNAAFADVVLQSTKSHCNVQ